VKENMLQNFLNNGGYELLYRLDYKSAKICLYGFKNYFVPEKGREYKHNLVSNMAKKDLWTLDMIPEGQRLDILKKLLRGEINVKEYIGSLSDVIENGDKTVIVSNNDIESDLIIKILKNRGFIENINLYIVEPNNIEQIENIKKTHKNTEIFTVGLNDSKFAIELEPDISESRGTKTEKLMANIFRFETLNSDEEKDLIAISEKLISDAYEEVMCAKSAEEKAQPYIDELKDVFKQPKNEQTIAEAYELGQKLFEIVKESGASNEALVFLVSKIMADMANETVNKTEINNEQREGI
ncbi:MAG: hypothetical protein K6B70_06530, partial [Clostridia bacterium]|nr:hypothetical protein [Clostridia bacterium]